MAKPDEELASRVVNRMRKAGLLSESALTKIQEGVSTGTLTSEDWKLMVELELAEKKGASSIEDK